MNNTVKILLLAGAGVALSLILIGGGYLMGRSTNIYFQQPLAWVMRWQQTGAWCSSQSSSAYRGMRPGWMGGYGFEEDPVSGDILTIAETEPIVQKWLGDLDSGDLEIEEVMIFDNHAYVVIREMSTGIGAMEILVDPDTRSVYPEQGANMMWNLKYSPMGMNHGWTWTDSTRISQQEIEDMPVSPEEAVAAAQRYLDQYSPGKEADDHVKIFYGYYTLHVLEDDHMIGMLSVNGYSAEVLFHSWHGELLEISEH